MNLELKLSLQNSIQIRRSTKLQEHDYIYLK